MVLGFRSLLLVLSLIQVLLISCSSVDKKSDTPEGAYAIAQEYEKDEMYEEAIRRYTDVKNRFPYSQFATKAELSIADVYFKQESFLEAQLAYQNFRELHPSVENIDYVVFRVGLSYYMQLPDTIDRDLAAAHSAISAFEELLKKYPNSALTVEAKEKQNKAYQMLAEKEKYIADFYFKRKNYESALVRYEGLLKKYSGQGFELGALYNAALSAKNLGQDQKAKSIYSVLMQQYPESAEASALRGELGL